MRALFFYIMIFYFSGTGNTRWVAEELAKKTGEKLLCIPDELKGECSYFLQEGERLGFCFPVHGWQPPRIVKDFINKVTFSFKSPIYIYTILTCGDNIGQALELFKKELDKKRLQISSAYSLIMPESYVCLPFMYTDTPENEINKIHKATIELTRIANEIISRESGIVRINTGKFPWILSHVIGAYFNTFMISDKKFFVDENICIHCRKCEKTCPTGNIFIKNGLPHWHHNNICTNCLSCYHHCPKHAINYGKITRKRGQYFFGHTTNSH